MNQLPPHHYSYLTRIPGTIDTVILYSHLSTEHVNDVPINCSSVDLLHDFVVYFVVLHACRECSTYSSVILEYHPSASPRGRTNYFLHAFDTLLREVTGPVGLIASHQVVGGPAGWGGGSFIRELPQKKNILLYYPWEVLLILRVILRKLCFSYPPRCNLLFPKRGCKGCI